MADEVLNVLFEVIMFDDCIAHLFMFVFLFMFCFLCTYTFSSLGQVYNAGFCTFLKYVSQDGCCMRVWVTADQGTYWRAEIWAHRQHQTDLAHYG